MWKGRGPEKKYLGREVAQRRVASVKVCSKKSWLRDEVGWKGCGHDPVWVLVFYHCGLFLSISPETSMSSPHIQPVTFQKAHVQFISPKLIIFHSMSRKNAMCLHSEPISPIAPLRPRPRCRCFQGLGASSRWFAELRPRPAGSRGPPRL